jgi:hypothetical protein
MADMVCEPRSREPTFQRAHHRAVALSHAMAQLVLQNAAPRHRCGCRFLQVRVQVRARVCVRVAPRTRPHQAAFTFAFSPLNSKCNAVHADVDLTIHIRPFR